MIYIDQPFKWDFKGKKRTFRHMISDDGTEKLLEFGRKMGLKESWLQKKNKYDEHFDLYGIKIELAIKSGAVEISFKEFIKIIQNKRLKARGNERETKYNPESKPEF